MNASAMKSSFSPGLTLALAVLMILLSSLALWFAGRGEPLESAFVRESQKAQLVSRMRADLYAAAEAEKKAVLADTDQASVDFANQARAAVDKVAAGLTSFQVLAQSSAEQGGAKRFEEAFAEYRKVDEEVLALAVQNTNLKAFALSFGKAAGALDEMEKALRPLLDGSSDKLARQAQRVLFEAQRIQSLHAPHIMEKEDPRMDALEKKMATADKAARAGLASLGREPGVPLATQAYDTFWKRTAEIVALSRRNTNVRSLVLSLERKTKVLAACDEALRVLDEGIRERMASKATR